MKKLCESIREHGMEITNFKKISYENEKISHICKEKFEYKWAKGKNIVKSEIIVIIEVNIEVLQIVYVIQSFVYLKKFL